MDFFSYFRQRYKHIRRYNQIMRVLLKYGFEDLVTYMEEKKRFSFLKRLIPRATYMHAMNLTKWERIRNVCIELGPTFVKFGQILSNHPDLLPHELITELEKLQDSVPPVPDEEALKVVELELKKPVAELFQDFEPKAIASASMAQVHRATLKTGEKIVLKIQRPGIQEIIESDIKVMYYLADLFSKRIPSLKSFDPVGLVSNFEESIMKELDFVHESVNIQRFNNNFTKDPTNKGYVRAPFVYRQFTTSRVLTLEYIDGIKISHISKLTDAGLDRKLIARRLAASYFKQIFNHGFFHADPHPGNIFILSGNNICFLDFGMMGNILQKDVEQLGNLFLSVTSMDVRKIIRAFQKLSSNATIRDYRQLEIDLTEFVNNYAVQDVNENEVSALLISLKDIVVKHGMKVPTHFYLLARSLVSVEGVIRQLDPEIRLDKMMRPYLVRTIWKHYDPMKFAKSLANSVYDMGIYMEEFPGDFKAAMRRINAGEIKVDLRHQGIDPLVHTINRVTRQIITAIIITGIIVGSAQLMIHEIKPLWGGTSALAILGFVIAGLLANRMITDLRKGDHDDWSGWKND